MADREKVIKGLENCITGFDCPSKCPYLDDCNDLMKPMFVELAKDILALLKEQPKVVQCKNCKWYDERISMCNNCGLPREQTFFCADGKRKK